jgi:DNA repair exonuclease SbcCD ATPase subunit
MHDTDKMLQKLTELSGDLKSLQGNVIQLQDGQTLLQADVKGLQNGQHSLQGAVKGVQEAQKSFQETEDRRGKLLTGIADIASTILQEQHAQRTDIRSLHDQAHSLHDELHATKEELRSEILTSAPRQNATPWISRQPWSASSKATNSASMSLRMLPAFRTQIKIKALIGFRGGEVGMGSDSALLV